MAFNVTYYKKEGSKSKFESVTGEILQQCGIRHEPEPYILHLQKPKSGKMVSFKPDYLIGNWFLETHSSKHFSDIFVDKLHLFMRSDFHQSYKLAVVVDTQYIGHAEYALSSKGLTKRDIADEFYYIDSLFARHEPNVNRRKHRQKMNLKDAVLKLKIRMAADNSPNQFWPMVPIRKETTAILPRVAD